MFHRKRATSNPPRVVRTPPSQAASLAATQAFLANRASNGDLSAAAAAAALRSHTTSPVPVGHVQTRRMQRRGSVTSNGTAPDRPGLLRRTSSGSMTERTFRDPSPNRPSSSHGPYSHNDEAPPVPALPKGIRQALSPTPAQQKAARRAASVEPMQRVSSPPPRLVGGRGVSLDRGPGAYKPHEGAPRPKVTSPSAVGELERPGSRNSVNFSRPMSPQNSPPTSPHIGGLVRSPPPPRHNGIAGLPKGEAERILESIQETAATPVKKKKRVVPSSPSKGSHLVQGTTSGAAQAAALLATPQRQPPPMSSTASSNTVIMSSGINELPKPKKKKKRILPSPGPQVQDANDGFGNAYPSDTESVTSERSSTNERPRSYNTRAAGLLMKQPSVVREDREAEEQEERSPPAKQMNGQVAQNGFAGVGTPANTSKVVSKTLQHSKAVSQIDALRAPKRTSLDIPGADRHQSLSPARSTHFSSEPEYETPDGIKHQPPARSVSPAKSALKHSPSRGQSPVGASTAARRVGLATSEASDTASNISDECSRSVPKKKKSARVSFDDDSVTVGRAASPPMDFESPIIVSPQNKSKGRSWIDLVREQKQHQSIVNPDQDSDMKPTPSLPSFGSIRRDRTDESSLDDVPVTTPIGDSIRDTLRKIGTSSDQIVGGIFSQDAASKENKSVTQPASQQGSKDPLPPEVTLVEGSGYHSDEEASLSNNQQRTEGTLLRTQSPQGIAPSVPASQAASTELSSESTTTEKQNASVPLIALQPATPGLEIADEAQTEWPGMPGQSSEPAKASHEIQAPASSPVHSSIEITPATIGLSEPEPEALAIQHDPGSPHLGGVADGLHTQIDSHDGDESEDTGDSIYSDAAEEPDDLDGDGFGSINAIIESPAPSPILTAEKSSPVSPIVKAPVAKTMRPSPLARKVSELSEPASDEGWDRAQEYWSGLSQERRRQLEHAAVPGALDDRVIPNKTMEGPNSVKGNKKNVPKKTPFPPRSKNPVLPPWPDKQYRDDITKPAQHAEPPLKSSLRKTPIENTGEPQLRSSMRDGPLPKSASRNGPQRTLPQPPEPRSGLQKKNRPMSAVAMVGNNEVQPIYAPGHVRASSAGVPQSQGTPVLAPPRKKAPPKKPTMRRNDSDSSSSFRKERSRAPPSGKYAMKRTMRPSSVDTQGPTNRASAMSARTASPAGSAARRPFSSMGPGGGTMRMSMRENTDLGKPAARTSLRGSSIDSSRAKSPSRFGFGKSSKPKPINSKPSSRFSSRFGDSSDEDDRRPAQSSRFADSSDEEATELTPVRGIPRRIDEGNSTDLDDSSEEIAPATSKPNTKGTKPTLSTKPEGLALATGSLRVASGDGPITAMGSGLQVKKAAEKDKKKRSFFGGLGSKKRDDPLKVPRADSESLATKPSPVDLSKPEETLPTGILTRASVPEPNLSVAHPVAKRERPVIATRISSAQNSPKSPKLQRRNTPKTVPRANDNSWPLSQSPGVNTSTSDGRPRTSDGAVANGAERPDIGTRRTTLQGAPPPPTAPSVVGKTEKKKRFGMLRKALGIQS